MKIQNNRLAEKLLQMVKVLALPAIVWLLMEVITKNISGVSVIANSADWKTLFRNLISTLAFALAISTNLSCGRMDLSLGAQMYAGVIFGGNLAFSLGFGGVGVLAFSMVIGGLCGLLIGFMFIKLKILPMVLGLGMTLVFECCCFMVNNQQGVIFFGRDNMDVLSNISFILIVCAAMVLVTTYLFQFSVYGYRYRAIQGSQKLAQDAGINIFSNCVYSYIIAGVLVAIAGVFTTAYSGTLAPVLGMTSNGKVFTNMFPMVVGVWIGSFCHNQQIGVLMGSLAVNILSISLAKMGIGLNQQNVIIYTLFLLFTIYNTNKGKIAYAKARRARIAQAKQLEASLAG